MELSEGSSPESFCFDQNGSLDAQTHGETPVSWIPFKFKLIEFSFASGKAELRTRNSKK